MKEKKNFEELVKEQQEIDSVYILLLILLTMLGFCGGYFANTILNKGVGIIGYCVGFVCIWGFILLIKFGKSAEERIYIKVQIKNVAKSKTYYCVSPQTSSDDNEQLMSIIINNDYMQYYLLKIENVKNVEETLNTLSKLPREFIAKNLLDRVEQGEDSIADILNTPVQVIRTKYGIKGVRKVLFDEIPEATEPDEEIARYIPKKKANM